MVRDIRDALFGSIFGVAVGDALGVPVEFSERGELKRNPVTGMRGYGAHNQPPGTWSDDTSLTLCLVDSLCKGYDLNDIAEKFVSWYRDGLWTPYGYAFDRGSTTRMAMENLISGVSPTESGGSGEWDNGNGSLMRISPLIFYTLHMPIEERFKIVHEVSSITHAHPRSLIACDFYVQYGVELLNGLDKINAYYETVNKILNYHTEEPFVSELEHFHRILEGRIWELPEGVLNSHGYVVYTLETSLWSFIRGVDFRDAVLTAVNMGHDTDTLGAVTGGLAGLFYGYQSIPEEWLRVLARREDMEALLERFYAVIKERVSG